MSIFSSPVNLRHVQGTLTAGAVLIFWRRSEHMDVLRRVASSLSTSSPPLSCDKWDSKGGSRVWMSSMRLDLSWHRGLQEAGKPKVN